ncbi:MAG: RNA polymerase sigma factor [Gammaproteobacteria bacterium]|nr:RNA polymerase sigma factor [Gammaproteobacteria bacterium]
MTVYFWQNKKFQSYLEQNWQRLYRLAYAWSHDPQLASDLVQEALSRSFKSHYQFENEKALNVWLYKVLVNCWRDHHRQRKETIDIDDAGLEAKSSPEHDHAQHQLQQQIMQAMAQLKSDHRQIITLVDLDELNYTEVADILGIAVGTVMSRLSRARSQLREIIKLQMPSLAKQGADIRRIK